MELTLRYLLSYSPAGFPHSLVGETLAFSGAESGGANEVLPLTKEMFAGPRPQKEKGLTLSGGARLDPGSHPQSTTVARG